MDEMCIYLHVHPVPFEAAQTGAEEGDRSIVIPPGDHLRLVSKGLTLVKAPHILLELSVGGDEVVSFQPILAQGTRVLEPIAHKHLHQLV